ncbi:MAG: HAMP domain-containing sensor histidine kinase [Armatimonadota bacterium]|nr:HAMP domain-containing sensor histidine kinase [Armatimonadota bacterium]
MSRLLLMLASKPNQRLLEEALAERYELVLFDHARYRGALPYCDLMLVDGVMLEQYMGDILSARQGALPVLLPVLLVTSRRTVGLATRNLWKSVDEVLLTPIERVELQARVEVLLRARQLSAELYQRNQELEAFVHAVTHELRAPLRAMTGFAEALVEDAPLPQESEAAGYLQRIVQAAQEAKQILDCLLTFARLGREVEVQQVWLEPLIQSCIRAREGEIASTGAQVDYSVECDSVEADPLLLKIVLDNLLSNALKFRFKDRAPRIIIRATPQNGFCRIEVQDNGIGILPEDEQRLFTPFTRLHGGEEYAGIGLGLSIVRKAVTIMGGRYGVVSSENEGSTFWISLPLVEGERYEGSAGGRQSE